MSRVPPPGDGCRIGSTAWSAADGDRLDRYAAALNTAHLEAIVAVADSEQERLRAEVERLNGRLEFWWSEVDRQATEVLVLRAEAERWRAAYEAVRDNSASDRRALERVREVADLWVDVDPDGSMTRAFASEHLRRVVGP